MKLTTKKFVTDSGNPYYIFFESGVLAKEKTGIEYPIVVLTEDDFNNLLKDMIIQKDRRI